MFDPHRRCWPYLRLTASVIAILSSSKFVGNGGTLSLLSSPVKKITHRGVRGWIAKSSLRCSVLSWGSSPFKYRQASGSPITCQICQLAITRSSCLSIDTRIVSLRSTVADQCRFVIGWRLLVHASYIRYVLLLVISSGMYSCVIQYEDDQWTYHSMFSSRWPGSRILLRKHHGSVCI